METSIDVIISDLPPGIDDVEKSIRDEVFKGVIRLRNLWIGNIETGEGTGSHGGPYVNTGEAANSIQMEPEVQGADEYVVFSDKIQTLIAEIGQPPGQRPPYRAISDWVHEKLQVKRDDPKHHAVVVAVQNKIEERGLAPFAPMEKAIIDVVADLEKRIGKGMDGKT